MKHYVSFKVCLWSLVLAYGYGELCSGLVVYTKIWLPRLVGKSMAKEIIFTGRKIGGRDAFSMGLVNHCVHAGQARSKALEIARYITNKGPLAIRMAKRAKDGGSEVDMTTGLGLEEECYEQLLHTNDRLEGLAAFAERRKPNYTGQ